MNLQELKDAISSGPVRVRLNDGTSYEIPSSEFALVANTTLHVLVKDESGELSARILAVRNITEVQLLEAA